MKYLIIILFLALTQYSFANNFNSVYKEMLNNKISTNNFELNSYITYVEMEYGKSEALNLHYKNKFKDLPINSITLVYSNFKETGHISQVDLNKERLLTLYNYDSTLFSNNEIIWGSLSIDGIDNLEDAKNTFHGFIISFYTSDDIILDKVYNGSYSLTDYLESSNAIASVYSDKDKTYTATLDLAIYNTLERNNNWKNMLIVTDLTGSMMPYSAQLIVWLKLNDKNKRAKSFTFFNDGDDKLDINKTIGKTGGIYYTDYDDLDQVINIAKTTRANGSGGDAMENDIEAILKGIELSENIEEVILIADNNAAPKDFILSSQIKKPIKIILCGVNEYINPTYLTLARNTGGSIHTIEEDLVNLIQINEGEIINIEGASYLLKNGEFQIL